MNPKLLVATTNAGKVAELVELLTDLPFEVVSLKDWPDEIPVVEETGETFEANAALKAEYYHQQTSWLTLSDDSGLVVDALGGRPGVYSARYAGEGGTSAQLVAKLCQEMIEVPAEKRTARFVCAIALCGDGVNRTFVGQCEGMIANEPRGVEGFGFDPVFIDPASGHTFAELTRAEKSAISHRGKALAQLHNYLGDYLGEFLNALTFGNE